MSVDLLCGKAGYSERYGGRIRFVAEFAAQVEPSSVRVDGEVLEIALTPREWDVTDRAARETAGRELLGDAYEAHCDCRSAHWFIRPEDNAACLMVFCDPPALPPPPSDEMLAYFAEQRKKRELEAGA